jgi:hypothetical protein
MVGLLEGAFVSAGHFISVRGTSVHVPTTFAVAVALVAMLIGICANLAWPIRPRFGKFIAFFLATLNL